MSKPGIRLLTLSSVIFILLFFSFVHGLFRLQLFKHVVNQEITEKLRIETLRMADAYQAIQDEEKTTLERIERGNQERSRLIVEQAAGVIAEELERTGRVLTPAEESELLALLAEFNSRPESCFWIFNTQGTLILDPRPGLTDVVPVLRDISESLVGMPSEGAVVLPGRSGGPDNPGYGKEIRSLGWTLVSFQPWSVLERKVESFEALKKLRTERLISQMGMQGNAGVVDKNMIFQEFTYAQLKGRSVNNIRLEGTVFASELLFNRKNGIREYVYIDPVSNQGKYGQTYVFYDNVSENTYFITQDKRGLFKGIDGRSLMMLASLGGASAVLLIINTGTGLWSGLSRRHPEE